ncbi:MAG: DUF3365 domain-containing protein, partial [Salinimicrobium sp.]
MKKLIFFIGSLLLLLGCKGQEKENETIPIAEVKVMEAQVHPGQKLLTQYCYACHNPSVSMDQMIAPPMAAIKAHYLINNPSKQEFISQISSYVQNPTAENSQLPGAINRFGLMPQQGFPPEAVEKIADYIYAHQIEEPEWFGEHWKAGPGNGIYRQQGRKGPRLQKTGQTYEQKGIEIAMAAQKNLGQHLMQQLEANSTIEVLEFCNENAIPLTNEVAQKYGASIQRVSDKNRNPQNKATKKEEAFINQYRKDLAWGHEPEPVLIDEGDSVRFYYPLVTNTLCLQCHGRKQDIDNKVQDKILQLYPKDEAIG